VKAGCTSAPSLTVTIRSTDVKLNHRMADVLVLVYTAMKVLGEDHLCGRKSLSQNHLMCLSLLQQMLLNVPTMIGNVKLQGHSIPNQQKKSRPLLIYMKFGTIVNPVRKLSHTKI